MKLQKLVYCLHGWHLAITGNPAIDGEFEAWPYGPVEEDLYHLFKAYRNKPITTYAQSWDGDEQKAFVVAPSGNKEFYDILNFVAERYMLFSATQLSAMTHKAGTPWSITRDSGLSVIGNDLIRDHFRTLAA
jgi:uncharacterized phage-associated protein